MSESSKLYLDYCKSLASRARNQVHTNPKVGACIVYNERIIGQGWHKLYGGAHAEVNAVQSVSEKDKSLIQKSQMYVTLEPCNHVGKTKPCTRLIEDLMISKVIIGKEDPSFSIKGKSIEQLQEKGIKTELQEPCQTDYFDINKHFGRPYICLKWVQSLDGFISKSYQKTNLSNRYSKILVHKWRSEFNAILVGKKTFEIDNPKLNTRYWPGPNPRKQLLTDSILNFSGFNIVNGSKLGFEESINMLYSKLKISKLFVEGGANTINSFIQSGLWDEARVGIARDIKLRSGVQAPFLKGKLLYSLDLGSDLWQIILPESYKR